MNLSQAMVLQHNQMLHTMGYALLQSAQAEQAALAKVMLEDLNVIQQTQQIAPHPNLGKQLDIRV
jgi:hypothetical protein